MGEWQVQEPEVDQLLGLITSAVGLMLHDLAEGCDCVVFGVIMLSKFAFLLLCSSIHRVLDSLLETLEALFTHSGKCSSAMFGDHSNTVNRSLSDSRVL